MGKQFIILEDAPNDQKLVVRTIEKASPDAEIELCGDIASFKKMIDQGEPDMVLSDYNLPDGNGLDALIYVKKKHPLVPFVFVTGMLNDEEQVARSILEGASGYVLKKNLNRLPGLITEILNTSEAHRHRPMEKAKKEAEKNMTLQRLEDLLGSAESFDQKEDILRIIQQIRTP